MPNETPRALKVEATDAAKRILARMHPGRAGISLPQALDDIARARSAGEAVRLAVEESTADGVTNWPLVGAALLANAHRETDDAESIG
jgi:hypothetical protein